MAMGGGGQPAATSDSVTGRQHGTQAVSANNSSSRHGRRQPRHGATMFRPTFSPRVATRLDENERDQGASRTEAFFCSAQLERVFSETRARRQNLPRNLSILVRASQLEHEPPSSLFSCTRENQWADRTTAEHTLPQIHRDDSVLHYQCFVPVRLFQSMTKLQRYQNGFFKILYSTLE